MENRAGLRHGGWGIPLPESGTPYVNRVGELELIGQQLQRLRGGESVRLAVVGEVGSGKSRILAEVLTGGRPDGVSILSGAPSEAEMERPFGVLIDALDLRPDSVDTERAAIARLVRKARLAGRAEDRHDVMTRIAGLIARLREPGPLLLVLDDAQWLDPLSISTVQQVLRAAAGSPLGVILSARLLPRNSLLDETVRRTGEWERIQLGPLAPEAVAALTRDLAGGEPSLRLAGLVAGAGGNPAYIVDLLRGLRRSGALWVHGGIADTDASLPPEAMRPGIMARLGRLTSGCQDLLTVAAVLGEGFTVDSLAMAMGRSPTEILAVLREACAAGLLTGVGGRLRFCHDLVRLTLYEATPSATRASLHLHIGNTLLRAGADASTVGQHLLRGEALGRVPADSPGDRARKERELPPGWERLSKTERRVARHAAEGLTNRDIGVLMGASPRTVETHLGHIYAKLGIASRVQLGHLLSGAIDLAGRSQRRSSNG